MSSRSPSPRLPVAVFLSGTGRTLENLLTRIDEGSLPLEIRWVVSSRPDVRGLQIARDAGLEHSVMRRREYGSVADYSGALFEACRSRGVELVVMAGFLCRVQIPSDFHNRVVNIHPSLIPAFCGKGYYGDRVHRAVLEHGVKLTGCTVHFVDDEYDHGPIIAQQAVPVLDGDTVERLAARVFDAECRLYPAALAAIAEGRVQVHGRWVKVADGPLAHNGGSNSRRN